MEVQFNTTTVYWAMLKKGLENEKWTKLQMIRVDRWMSLFQRVPKITIYAHNGDFWSRKTAKCNGREWSLTESDKYKMTTD